MLTAYFLFQISALIIENTFCSIPHLVREWPLGRFLSLFITQKWLSSSKTAKMPPTLPILMLSGLRDTVIPSSEMQELWEVVKQRRTKIKKKKKGCFNFLKDKIPMVEQDDVQPKKDIFETFRWGGHSM